jgi:hypothetical protein
MTDAPRKPFWKRKHWIAAAVLWLVLAYPLSAGPAACALGRGWIANSAYHFYSPLIEAERALWQWPPDTLWDRYCSYFYELGQRHRHHSDEMPHGKAHPRAACSRRTVRSGST